ncbi:mandelate racemase/muconate lactonizing enzyme family protein [Egicoccus sp. AB-alg6-2]|uniref:mandelate racemase/muconate lactonizing enzyme family protein n=1 Tax=Egicoccus sp. AB-alg6-2 TaxID=3242692 RepID=UPI00359EF591
MSPPAVIRDLTTRHLRLSLPRPWGPDVAANHLVVVEITLDDGTQGTGVSWTPRVGPEAVHALLEHDCRRIVTGLPGEPELVWDLLWERLHEGGSGGLTTIAMAGIDLALWDARGRRQERSLVDLLGRRHVAVPTYASGINLYYPLDDLLAQVKGWIDAGHRAVKIKVGRPDLAEDVERVAAVRDLLGPDRLLMVDANQRWDLPTARRAIGALAPYGLYWVEEPLLADATWAYAQLRASVDVPIAAGENAHTIHRFRDLLDAGAVDVAQPNVVRVGGVTPFLRIAQLAATYGVTVVPHLLPELSGQLASCLPGPTMVEDVDGASFAALGALAAPSGVTMEDAVLTARTGPGLGLRFVDHKESS